MIGTSELQPSLPERSFGTDARLWFGTMGGAVMWLLHLILAYLIAEFGCVSGWGEAAWWGISGVAWSGIGVSALMLLGTVASLLIARGHRRSLKDVNGSGAAHEEAGEDFMARSGFVSNQIFLVIIVVQSIPFVFYLQGC